MPGVHPPLTCPHPGHCRPLPLHPLQETRQSLRSEHAQEVEGALAHVTLSWGTVVVLVTAGVVLGVPQSAGGPAEEVDGEGHPDSHHHDQEHVVHGIAQRSGHFNKQKKKKDQWSNVLRSFSGTSQENFINCLEI